MLLRIIKYYPLAAVALLVACASQLPTKASEIEVGRIHKDGTIEVDSRQFAVLLSRYNKFEKAKEFPKEKINLARQIALTYYRGSPKLDNSKYSRVRFDFSKRIVYKSDGTWYRAKQTQKVLTEKFPTIYDDNTCYSLLDTHRRSRGYGKLLRVRNTGDHTNVDQYTFSNTYKEKLAKLNQSKTQLEEKMRKVRSDRRKFSELEQSLVENEAYNGSSCVTPTSTEVIPHKPGLALSKEELDEKYYGYCIDLATSVTSEQGIYKALSTAGGEGLINIHRKWKNDEGLLNTPACAVARRNGIRSTLDTEFRNTALLPAQVAKGLKICVDAVQASCEKEIRDWEDTVYDIRRAPIETKHQCENIQNEMSSLENEISVQLEPIEVAETQYSKLQAEYDSLPDSIPLSMAVCSL